MSINDFEELSLDERAEYVWNNGTYAEGMKYYNFNLRLYCLDDGRYSEVWYTAVEGDITDIQILTDNGGLQKWLSRIRLSL
jgi:hypothetical protein